MNTTKFNKYLKKIKAFDNLVDDLSDLSLVEQDLLKDYIKKLYESVSELDDSDKIEKKQKKHKKSIVAEKSKKHEEVNEEVQEEIKFVKPEAKEKKKQVSADEDAIDANKQIIEDTKFPVKEDKSVNASPEFLELFEINNSNELSQKLSQIPIKDLTKAFSINERIFTVKELFKGDKDNFEKVIGDLDKLTSLEEAKDYLVKNIIEKHGWDNPKMLKKVKGFVATVKRRYL